MGLDKIADIAGLIVVGSIITTLVAHPETKNVINALGGTFIGSLRASMGK